MAKFNRRWVVQPHGPLVQVAEGIWTVEGSIAMPLGRFPRRMTVLALAQGGLAVWSPISLDAEQMARVDGLGRVRFLIVPNAGHRLDVAAWLGRYPDAKVIAPHGAQADVAEAAPVGGIGGDVGDPALAFERVAGTKADEYALIVTRDEGRTLILNDIMSSIRRPRGLAAKLMTRLLGFGITRPRTSRPVRRMFVSDPAALATQFRAWAALPDLRRIIVSHVDVIEDAPRAALERAAADFTPLSSGAPAAGS